MATKIIPDSFRELLLDLNEPVDYSFFDENQEGNKKTLEPGPKSNEGVVKTTGAPIRNKDDKTQSSETPSNSDTAIQSPSSHKNLDHPNSEQSRSPEHHRPVESNSRSLSRSFSGSYESDFSNVDTNGPEQEQTSQSEHVTVVDNTDRPKTHRSAPVSEDESDVTDVSNEFPEPHTNNTPIYSSPNRKNQLQQDNSDPSEMRQLQAQQLTKAMNRINKKLQTMRFRPPWRDPNSNPLPSDRTASFYDLYEEFTRKSKDRPISDNGQWVAQAEIAVCRPYHATLNRYRQQERIQMENYALARRLQNVRPSPGMTRKEQLREYKRYFIPSTFFLPRQTNGTRRPGTAISSYRVDHAGDHDIKCLNSERTSRPNLSIISHAQRNTRSAGSRSMTSSNDATSFYDVQSPNKSFRSGSKERPKSTREKGNRLVLPEMNYTIWSNTGRSNAQGRHDSGLRMTENRCTMNPVSHNRRVSATSTRHVDEAVGISAPRGKDNDKRQSDVDTS
ncbi:hypothetical protein FGIG_07424 [Fasciola gigantica]|uniref:Uncharacterized protein n=1 Tax=Fasciola gigantica TaxID=46835 RepID=A0A504YM61_FASGI|nr:hypothetical protein FGIG_07424 [Fasciola gigantica]